MSYRNFTIRNKTEWDSYIKQALEYETYQTWYYHSLNKEGEPLLFVYEEEDTFIALPLIKRKIENSPFFDLTSVYGYCGPVSNKDLSKISTLTIQYFKAGFLDFMKKESCICVFSRIHPFIKQDRLLENIGGLKENGNTIYIDLTSPIEEQRRQYDKRLSRQIRKLREKEYSIKDVNSPEDIKNFTKMYVGNMDRLNASPHYYFNEEYFSSLLNANEFNNKLILIYDGLKLMCGAVILLSNNIIRNHLSATAAEYTKESPSKLLTDEISMIGRRLKKKIFHLGGGVGGKQDSLFEYKRYFSDLQITDKVWCYINDDAVYNDLVARRGNALISDSDYFPLYRKTVTKAPGYPMQQVEAKMFK